VASSEEGIELIAGEEVEREINKRGTTGAEAEVVDGRESKTEAASSIEVGVGEEKRGMCWKGSQPSTRGLRGEGDKTGTVGRVKRVLSLESIEARFVDKHHDTTLSTGASTLVFKVNPKIRSARRDGRLRRRKFKAKEIGKAQILSLDKGKGRRERVERGEEREGLS